MTGAFWHAAGIGGITVVELWRALTGASGSLSPTSPEPWTEITALTGKITGFEKISPAEAHKLYFHASLSRDAPYSRLYVLGDPLSSANGGVDMQRGRYGLWLAGLLMLALAVGRPAQGQTNMLTNPGFEATLDGAASDWHAFTSGYVVDTTTAHTGTTSIQMTNTAATDARGAYQTVTINQTRPWPLVLTGWSKSSNVSGTADHDYALYADVTYVDGTSLYAQFTAFTVGTHDWQQVFVSIIPDKPIRSVNMFAMFRNHTGTVWFDDFSMITPQFAGGLKHFPNEGHQHMNPAEPVIYNTDPPTSGNHYPTFVVPGFYSAVQVRGRLTHSLEHGNIVIYYDPARVTGASLDGLKALVTAYPGHLGFGGVVVTPRTDAQYPIIATAWQWWLRETAYNAQDMSAFVQAYVGKGPEKLPHGD
jgi:hypothetical protein